MFRAVAAAVAGLALASSQQTGASRFALAQVDDPRGKALVDIGADDFVVQENGVEREILDVRVADYPVVIVLDNGAAARANFPAMRAAVARFIEKLGPRPLAVVTTAGKPMLLARFDDERAAIVQALDAAEVPGEANARLLGATALAAETIRSTGALFSSIVVAASSVNDEEALAESDELVALTAPIVDSRAVVHVVAHSGATAADAPGSNARLRALASQTHGDYTTIYSGASYQPALDRVAVRLTTEMLIEYLVPPGSRAADVKIGVRIPGARVRGLGVAPR